MEAIGRIGKTARSRRTAKHDLIRGGANREHLLIREASIPAEIDRFVSALLTNISGYVCRQESKRAAIIVVGINVEEQFDQPTLRFVEMIKLAAELVIL